MTTNIVIEENKIKLKNYENLSKFLTNHWKYKFVRKDFISQLNEWKQHIPEKPLELTKEWRYFVVCKECLKASSCLIQTEYEGAEQMCMNKLDAIENGEKGSEYRIVVYGDYEEENQN